LFKNTNFNFRQAQNLLFLTTHVGLFSLGSKKYQKLKHNVIDPPIKVCLANFNHPLRKGDCSTKVWKGLIGGAIAQDVL